MTKMTKIVRGWTSLCLTITTAASEVVEAVLSCHMMASMAAYGNWFLLILLDAQWRCSSSRSTEDAAAAVAGHCYGLCLEGHLAFLGQEETKRRKEVVVVVVARRKTSTTARPDLSVWWWLMLLPPAHTDQRSKIFVNIPSPSPFLCIIPCHFQRNWIIIEREFLDVKCC